MALDSVESQEQGGGEEGHEAAAHPTPTTNVPRLYKLARELISKQMIQIRRSATILTSRSCTSQSVSASIEANQPCGCSTTITTSLASSIKQYRVENGRTYHQYKDGQYAYPNDEAEKDRLDLQHHLFRLTLDEKLYLAPIKDDIQDVLDIGTGTGLWALEFADEHPSAVVIGTDLSPIQPTFIPPNLSFIIDDANEEWVFKQKFDFIHTRQLHCAVEEKNMIRQAYENLKPGGWFEMQDLSFPVCNDDGTLTTDHPIYKWSAFMLEASKRIHQDLDNPPKYPQWMKEAGFINVRYEPFKWPSNPWPRDKKHKTLGLWNLANTLDGLEGFTLAFFTRILGWQPEDVHVFLIGVREDTRNKQIHNYWPIHVSYGQKPETSE